MMERNATHAPMQVGSNTFGAIAPPPGLAQTINKTMHSALDEYIVGEQVFVLRSNRSWTPGTIASIDAEKVTIFMQKGTKQVRKDMIHSLVQRSDPDRQRSDEVCREAIRAENRAVQVCSDGRWAAGPRDRKVLESDGASLAGQILQLEVDTARFQQKAELEAGMSRMQQKKTAVLATQTEALETENARLAHENMLLRLQNTTPMYEPFPFAVAEQFPSQDAYGYMGRPLGIVEETKPISFASKLMSKFGGKGKGNSLDNSNFSNWSSITTAPTDLGSSCSSMEQSNDSMGLINALNVFPHGHTTVMMRNIPNNFSREQLLELMNDEGFKGRYDLLYLPMDLKKKVGLGYAFINFVGNEDAEDFGKHFQGFTGWDIGGFHKQSEKICEVKWSDVLQGVHDHVERYRDCPVMHESIPDEFKPILFKDGERIAFPSPTKKLRAPRPWSRRH